MLLLKEEVKKPIVMNEPYLIINPTKLNILIIRSDMKLRLLNLVLTGSKFKTSYYIKCSLFIHFAK